jgi:DNA-binding MarR family transcriptional regulator
MRERQLDADTLRLLLDVLIEIEGLDKLPAHGAKVLTYLAAQPDGSADQAAVAARFSLSVDQMFRVSEKLHALRLVRRRELPTDRRAYRLTVTEQGRGEIDNLYQAVQSVVQKFKQAQLSRSAQ